MSPKTAGSALDRSPKLQSQTETRWLSLSWKAIGIAATALGYAAAVWLALSSRLDNAFDKRLAPYDMLAQAQFLERREQWDEATNVYRNARAQLDTVRATPALVYLVYDGLLHSLANTYNPERYSQDLLGVESRIGPRIPRTAFRLNELGYYYLRVGDTTKAGRYLNESWMLNRKNKERFEAAINEFNLAKVGVAEGRVHDAVALLKGAIADDPALLDVVFNPPPDDGGWMAEMRGLYGSEFGTRWRAALDSLRRELPSQGRRGSQ